jgi:hypothetical protein
MKRGDVREELRKSYLSFSTGEGSAGNLDEVGRSFERDREGRAILDFLEISSGPPVW